MAQYDVVARGVQFYLARVEAEDDEEATLLASQLTEQEFKYLDGGDWEIINVQKIHQKPKQAKLF